MIYTFCRGEWLHWQSLRSDLEWSTGALILSHGNHLSAYAISIE